MTRSPLFYPLNRGTDGDAGGVSDLQTDVMRFMAILALCLVAIFALVQSIPLAPTAETPVIAGPAASIAPESGPAAEPPQAVAEAPQEISLTRPQPKQLPTAAPTPLLTRPRAAPLEKITTPPASAKPPRDGFTLRFDDELALTRLVARNEVGLYAILADGSYRMTVNRGQFSFWRASMPKQFHEMEASTVPAAVLDAFRHSSALSRLGLKWGVTLPSATSIKLSQYLREETGGDLVIDAHGELRLE